MTPDLSLEGQPGISKRKKGEGVSPQASGMCGVGGGGGAAGAGPGPLDLTTRPLTEPSSSWRALQDGE